MHDAVRLIGPQAHRHSLSVPCGTMATVNTETLIEVWQRLLADPHTSWVVFEHGTCVVLMAPEGEPTEQVGEIRQSSARRVPVVRQGTSG